MDVAVYAVMIELMKEMSMRYSIERFAEVQYNYVRLDSTVVGHLEVIHRGEKLRFTWKSRSESMIFVCKNFMLLQVISGVSTDAMF